ncbi:MAG: hypothetical protein EA389_06855 [Ilumatobacter sp.]|nr:MAG: hypothetical protein EA389_06855 [Ilumatobacter sp.]
MDINTLPPEHDTSFEQPVQQLSLLPTPEVPLQFRLDAATRRRGLRHVAEIRRMLAEREAARTADGSAPLRPETFRSDRAA